MAATLIRGKYIITRVTGPASAETLTESAPAGRGRGDCRDRTFPGIENRAPGNRGCRVIKPRGDAWPG